ncbi:MAG: DUF3606 domain-containing protein [Mesorhizobium sp.]|nr:DUF3606 domain-containing protein [Mesorhizobium sp. M1D.F.Ca.ET.231.01.1.1]TGP27825.1 DUF3606 domain-containing protein [Mesorhizobium sp. M1D.F.Ca.ET.234.01.1.1]TGS42175.1 DUF3606 domain-containing protein [Mesorhizobium sp. M1D.F.Ca.ET.184.01.1.1]TGS59526.1 DUF3606 domain-containing protein [Mesorhizobium sp. M1D.F.Ca.ET.183.01.1.1]TIT76304.1 MAG: DUF3606 domain-containing protein [Mesorhizobium sp.]
MAGVKMKRDFRDRDRVSADEDYEVHYFAKQHTSRRKWTAERS